MRIRRMRFLLVLLALLAGATTALAAGPSAVRKQVEASMLVTGRVTIEQDGGVSAWEIDQREKLPDVVAGLVDRSIPGWKFEPVLLDGKPTRGHARMSLRLVADQLEDGRYRVSIRNGYFGRDALSLEERQERGLDEEQLTRVRLQPPVYPAQALEWGVQGTVYLIVRVGRQGTVEDVAVEQVNLRVLGSEKEMQRMRDVIVKPALAAARKWTFRVPVKGEWADEETWSARVPVDYRFNGSKTVAYGEWEAYVPGPRMPVPWHMESLEGFDIAPDTLVAGQVHQAGLGLKLLTPLEGG